LRATGVGEGIVSKIVAFVCVVVAVICCAWLASWPALPIHAPGAWATVATAGGLFTIAIAVLIRD
jgi:hypothetical protein